MSVVTPIATIIVRRSEVTLRANNRHGAAALPPFTAVDADFDVDQGDYPGIGIVCRASAKISES
jgi:hypothetical protein